MSLPSFCVGIPKCYFSLVQKTLRISKNTQKVCTVKIGSCLYDSLGFLDGGLHISSICRIHAEWRTEISGWRMTWNCWRLAALGSPRVCILGGYKPCWYIPLETSNDALTYTQRMVYLPTSGSSLWWIYPELPKAKLNLHVTLKDSLYSKCLFYFSTCGNKYMVGVENGSGAKRPNWQFFTHFSRKLTGFSRTSHGFSRTLALLVCTMIVDLSISQHAYNVLPKLKVQV